MGEPFSNNDQSFLELSEWQHKCPGLIAGFTTRNGGVSKSPFNTFNLGLHVNDLDEDVITNRTKLAQKLDIPLSSWVSGTQVHGKNIKVVELSDKGRGSYHIRDGIQDTDGLITNKRGLLCTAFFADCVPLFFFDPQTLLIGIAHAGWQGTVKGIGAQMVNIFSNHGVDIRHLLVCIGPCISGEKYEVDDRVISQIHKKYYNSTVTQLENKRYLLDLKQLNVEILLQSGVLRHNISITNYCTYLDDDLFFSHRRDRGKTGRMLGYIGYT